MSELTKRGVTQFGRVLGLGPRCRRFKSCRLDQTRIIRTLYSKLEKGSDFSFIYEKSDIS